MALAAAAMRRSASGLFRSKVICPIYFSTKTDTSFNADEMLKSAFFDVKKKFETALGILRQQKIVIDPESPKAVADYAKIMKTVREKAGLYSEGDRIRNTIRDSTQGIVEVRTYFEKLSEMREKSGIKDTIGAEKMMIDALDKVEKQLKKPLMRDDKKGMSLLQAEFAQINKKLGVSPSDLPKLEEELELDIAKAELQDIKKEAEEAIEEHKRRLGVKSEDVIVDVKSLDMRNFL